MVAGSANEEPFKSSIGLSVREDYDLRFGGSLDGRHRTASFARSAAKKRTVPFASAAS